MLRVILLIFILFKIFLGTFAYDSENEEKITFDLIEILEIRQCIKIIKDEFDLRNFNKLKEFSRKFEVLFLTREKLFKYFTGNLVFFWTTALIIEADSLSIIRELFELLKETKKEHEMSKFTWLVFLGSAGESEFERDQLAIRYDCEFIIIREVKPGFYELEEIYNLKDMKISLPFGTWDKINGLSATEIPFYVRRGNLHNVTVVYAADVQKRNFCPPGGYLGCAKREVFYDMEKMLNFDIHFVKYQRGRKDEYADVYDSRSSFHSLFFSYDVIAPLFKAYMNWYIRDPEVESRQDFYIQPFDDDLWYSLFFIIFIGSLVITICGFFNKYLRKEPPLPQLIDNIFTSFECFCSQDGGECRNYDSFRIAVITILLTALFIIPSYSAVITSFLAVRIPKVPFKNLEEFIKNGKYTLIRKEGALFPELYFKENKNPLIQTVRDRFVKAYPEEEGLRKTCRGLYVMTAPNIYLKDDNAECEFYQIPRAITFYFLELTLNKNSIFREIFMHTLPPFYSSGIMSHLQEDLDEVPIKNIDETQFFPVRIHQMAHIFLLMVIGCALGIFILSLEIFYKYLRRLRRFPENKKEGSRKHDVRKTCCSRNIKYSYWQRMEKSSVYPDLYLF